MGDDVREIRMVFSAEEVVLLSRAVRMAARTAPGWWTLDERLLLEELLTAFGMIVQTEPFDGSGEEQV